MVSVTTGQTFLNLGKKPKTDNVSCYCKKSRGTEYHSTTGDRQPYYEDCHILQDRSQRARGSICKGRLSNDCGLLAHTLRARGTALGIPKESSLLRRIIATLSSY